MRKCKVNKGMSLMSLLVSLSLFSLLFLIFNRWTANQRQSAIIIYQEYQAIQIAENQAERLLIEPSYESSIQQNGLHFSIQCNENQVIVRYPQGEFRLKNK